MAYVLAALLLVLWLAMRIRVLRRREARRDPGEAPVPAWAWLRALAAREGILPALAGLAAALALAALLLAVL